MLQYFLDITICLVYVIVLNLEQSFNDSYLSHRQLYSLTDSKTFHYWFTVIM